MSLPTCAANVRQRCVRACDTPQRTNTHPPQSPRMHAQQTIRPRNKPRARKMLASTIQISNNNPTPPPHAPTHGDAGNGRVRTEAQPPAPRPHTADTGTTADPSEPQQRAHRPTHTPRTTPGTGPLACFHSSNQHHRHHTNTPDTAPGAR
jgi:hypothetical protein